MGVLPACMCPKRSKAVSDLDLELQFCVEFHVVLILNLGFLEAQHVLLTAELFLRPPVELWLTFCLF